MSQNEEKTYKVKIACSHCGHINEIFYSDFRSAMIGNHFFKLQCQKEGCAKRTLVTYSLFTIPYNQGDVPEKIFEKLTLPQDTQIKIEKEK